MINSWWSQWKPRLHWSLKWDCFVSASGGRFGFQPQRSDPTVLWTAATIYILKKSIENQETIHDQTHAHKKYWKKSKPAEMLVIMWSNSISGLAGALQLHLRQLENNLEFSFCVYLTGFRLYKEGLNPVCGWDPEVPLLLYDFSSHKSTLIYTYRAVPTEDVMLQVLLGLPLLSTTLLLLETLSRLLNIYLDTSLCQKNLSIARDPSKDPLPQDEDAISWPHCSNINSFTCLRPKFSCFLLHSLVSFLHLPILGSEEYSVLPSNFSHLPDL